MIQWKTNKLDKIEFINPCELILKHEKLALKKAFNGDTPFEKGLSIGKELNPLLKGTQDELIKKVFKEQSDLFFSYLEVILIRELTQLNKLKNQLDKLDEKANYLKENKRSKLDSKVKKEIEDYFEISSERFNELRKIEETLILNIKKEKMKLNSLTPVSNEGEKLRNNINKFIQLRLLYGKPKKGQNLFSHLKEKILSFGDEKIKYEEENAKRLLEVRNSYLDKLNKELYNKINQFPIVFEFILYSILTIVIFIIEIPIIRRFTTESLDLSVEDGKYMSIMINLLSIGLPLIIGLMFKLKVSKIYDNSGAINLYYNTFLTLTIILIVILGVLNGFTEGLELYIKNILRTTAFILLSLTLAGIGGVFFEMSIRKYKEYKSLFGFSFLLKYRLSSLNKKRIELQENYYFHKIQAETIENFISRSEKCSKAEVLLNNSQKTCLNDFQLGYQQGYNTRIQELIKLKKSILINSKIP